MKAWKKQFLDMYVRVVRFFLGVKKKKVVFTSFNGKSYSDNPRAISETLHKVLPDIEIVWLFRDTKKQEVIPYKVRCVNVNSWVRTYKELATAAVYINNFSFQKIPKSRKQLFIQTWHGDKAFKKVLNDALNAPKGRILAEQRKGYCNVAIAGSIYGEKQFRSAFRYEGDILKAGTPRNDKLIANDAQQIETIKNTLHLEETRIMLYAPTLRKKYWKKNELQPIEQLNISAILSKLEERDKCKWVCLLRAHPAAVGLNCLAKDCRIIDVSDYEDMADLLLVSDMLITDYSSCAGDFALTGRPIVLFQADRQEYLDKERTFYFNMEDSPYFIAESQEELETIISGMTEEKAKENCKKILEFYGDCETGHASEAVAKIIKDWIS